MQTGGSNNYAFFDLVRGLNSANHPASMEDMGDGWWRCSVEVTVPIDRVKVGPAESLTSLAGSEGSIYIQEPKLEVGQVATDFSLPNANLLAGSNDFAFGGSWSLDTGVTTSSGQAGYDGSNDAWELNRNSATQHLAIRQSIDTTGLHTYSMYAKAGTLSNVVLMESGSGAQVWFDLAAGAVSHDVNPNASIATEIQDAGNGWYRCSITVEGSSSGQVRLYPSALNNGYQNTAGTIYIQDAKLEQNYYASGYIETT